MFITGRYCYNSMCMEEARIYLEMVSLSGTLNRRAGLVRKGIAMASRQQFAIVSHDGVILCRSDIWKHGVFHRTRHFL